MLGNSRRLSRALWASCGVAVLLGLAGCGPTPQVTVTLKPADLSATEPAATAGQPAAASGAEVATTAPAAGFGNLAGTVLFDGAPPELSPAVTAGQDVRDKDVCSAKAIPDESLQVDAETKGVRNVFIYLEKPPAGVDAGPVPDTRIEFDQIGCRFTPHVLAVRTKQTVFILNSDPVAHNTHTFPNRNVAFNGVVKVNEKEGVPLVYARSEQVPLEVKCDFHPWMRGYHLPLEHSFVGLTDEKGKFEIKGLPSGTHSFRVWQEKGGLLERAYKVTIKADATEEVKISFGAAKFARFEGPRPAPVIINPSPLVARAASRQ